MSRQLLIGIIVLLIIVAAIGAYMYTKRDPLSGVALPISHWVLGGKGGIQMTVTSNLVAGANSAAMVGHNVTVDIPELGSPSGTVKTAVPGKAPGTLLVTTAPVASLGGADIQTGSSGTLMFE